MALATLTTKGQLTIPKKIRESLKLHTGDKIEIIVTAEREATIKIIGSSPTITFRQQFSPYFQSNIRGHLFLYAS